MATRKPKSEARINPVQVCAIALRNVKNKADYNRIGAANSEADLQAAWQTLSEEEQTRIHRICGSEPEPDLQAIANELVGCTALLQLRALKAQHGEDTVRQAWRLLPTEERRRLKGICDGQQAEVVVASIPTSNNEQWNGAYTQNLTEQWSEEQAKLTPEPAKQPKRSLFEIGVDMHQSADELEAKLDAIDDPDEQAQLIDLWLQQNAGLQGEMAERVNAYLWVIRKQKHLAEYRASEAKRIRELAEQSENLAKRLEGQLLQFMDVHNLSKLETKDFKVSPRHASTEPLIVDENYSIAQVPDEFVVVSKTINRKAAKEAIKAGQQLPFAKLGAKSRYLYIR